MLKTAICACSGGASDGRSAGDRRGVRAGWVSRVGILGGYREGYTGVLPTHRPAARGASPDSEAGPVGPCRGPEWVVRVQRTPRATGTVQPTPAGPGRHPAGTSLAGPRKRPSRLIGARIDLISYKVS